jgi:uncharacterized protein YegL
LATDSALPLALVITLDVSGSMEEGRTIDRAKDAAISLIGSLRPTDTAAVISFDDRVRVEQPFTNDKAALRAAISRLQPTGATALYDAVAQSVRLGQASRHQRRAVVILSDGAESGGASQLDREGSLAAAENSGVLFYVVGVGFETDRPYLEELAHRARGRFFEAFEGAGIPSVYVSLAELLRSQLVVTAQSSAPADHQDRSVRISVVRGTATGSAEQSYRSLRPMAGADQASVPAPATVSRVPTAADQASVPAPATVSRVPTPVVTAGAVVAVAAALLAVFVRRRRRHFIEVPSEAEFVPIIPGYTADPIPREAFEREPTQATLIVVAGPDDWKGRTFDVGEAPVTLGTHGGCGIRLPETSGVAPDHVRIWARDGKLMLHHLAMGATTSVDGNAITWASLADGDELQVGPFILRCVGCETPRSDASH